MEKEQIKKTTNQKLCSIQTSIKCNKGNYNSFGGYKYRSCEDILESVKPYLDKEKAIITLSDKVEMVGTRFYVKAIATFIDIENDNPTTNSIQVEGLAREEDTKKGMDASQITGAASSYARKYALNGLLLLDDTKDADTEEKAKEEKAKAKKTTETETPNVERITSDQLYFLTTLNIPKDWLLKQFGTEKLADLTMEQAQSIINSYNKKKAERQREENHE